jgi:glucose/arabinose dehydrogenase
VLPEGFCAVVVGTDLGRVRHLAVAPNGDVLAALSGNTGGILVLRDTSGDGRADVHHRVAAPPGSGIALDGTRLFYAPNDRVLRWEWPAGTLEPAGEPAVVVRDLPSGGHGATGIAVEGGRLFASVGSRTNSCQREDREARSPGIDPCPELPTRAGVWRFDAGGAGQTQSDGAHFATGLRNPMALAIQPGTGDLFAMVHGRDQLGQNWGFSDEDNAEKPAEEFVALHEGSDAGWPYCYYDPDLQKKVLAPEYGGDGREVGRCGQAQDPLIGFPAHWAPNALVFYDAEAFPARYRGGAFIAFHGSWNRAPLPQAGYRVVFVPFKDGKPSGRYETFAMGVEGPTAIRPSGLAVGPDGSLYVGADASGTIWRIMPRH